MPIPIDPLTQHRSADPSAADELDLWARAVVEHVPDVVTAVDDAGRILYDSPSVLRVLGYAPGELVGTSAFALIHPEDLSSALETLFQTASGPGGVSSLIYRFRHKGGGWRYLESVGTAVDGSQGITVIVTSRDVTEQVRAVDAIRCSIDRLEARAEGRAAEVDDLQMEMLQRLARAAELRDDETGRHTRRVAEISALLADRLGLNAARTAAIRGAAPLHDVGKIGVPDGILRKRGTLTPDEVRVMRTHTVLGGRILAGGRSDLMRTAESIALHHHERWDGSGYPHGLHGTDIPLPARIVAVADFFDALTHDRPYRMAVPPDEVADAIGTGAASHFDPDVARAFQELDLAVLASVD